MRPYPFTLMSIVLIFIMLSGCKSNVENTLEGVWSIDTIVYKGYEIRYCLSSNVISFEEEFCDLANSVNSCEGLLALAKKGAWQVVYNIDSVPPLTLNIRIKNEIFDGTHGMIFRKDEVNKLLKMELRSDSLYVVCRKGLFDYDRSTALMNDLVRKSH
jgi:hypothetical protein